MEHPQTWFCGGHSPNEYSLGGDDDIKQFLDVNL